MQFTNIVMTVFTSVALLGTSASALAVRDSTTASTTELAAIRAGGAIIERQSLGELEMIVNEVFRAARNNKAQEYRARRQTIETTPATTCSSPDCRQCRNGHLTAALFEVAGCGIVALGVTAASLGTAAILEVGLFYACEGVVVGNYWAALAECRGGN